MLSDEERLPTGNVIGLLWLKVATRSAWLVPVILPLSSPLTWTSVLADASPLTSRMLNWMWNGVWAKVVTWPVGWEGTRNWPRLKCDGSANAPLAIGEKPMRPAPPTPAVSTLP